MKFIIDTNIYIKSLRDEKFNARLRAFNKIPTNIVYLSHVVFFELLIGSKNTTAAQWIYYLVESASSKNRFLGIDSSTWRIAANIQKALPKATREKSFTNDLLIAASARKIGATIVTNNNRDFVSIASAVPISIENW